MPTITSGVVLGVTHVLPASEALMQTSACACVVSAQRRIVSAAAGANHFLLLSCSGTNPSATRAHATKPTWY
ncbi:hypothetical protein DQP58_01680 [Mycobacterium colombiense]|uniref:Uncharacterized protein n=1 Tax=Mycobacterium colombiense TaxID=339268 RepID=A0A329KX92_9MYCO|nr:hypothetical protein DQP58_01680 [Mycobacterium colombiense]